MIVVKAYSEKAKNCIHRDVPNNDEGLGEFFGYCC